MNTKSRKKKHDLIWEAEYGYAFGYKAKEWDIYYCKHRQEKKCSIQAKRFSDGRFELIKGVHRCDANQDVLEAHQIMVSFIMIMIMF